PIAGEEQAAPVSVPDRQAEHAATLLQKTVSPLLVSMDDDFRVASGAEDVALPDELGPQRGMVVDLPVEHLPHAAVLVGDGLPPAGKIDDRQTTGTQTHRVADVYPRIVGPAVHEDVPHGDQLAAVHRSPVQIDYAHDAAHGQASRAR